MKNQKSILLVAFGLLFNGICFNAVAQTKQTAIITQADMNASSQQNLNAADKELNLVYKKALSTLNMQQKTLLVNSQRNWLIYRDSYTKLFEDIYAGGSMMGMAVGDTKTQLTKARTVQLKNLINR